MEADQHRRVVTSAGHSPLLGLEPGRWVSGDEEKRSHGVHVAQGWGNKSEQKKNDENDRHTKTHKGNSQNPTVYVET